MLRLPYFARTLKAFRADAKQRAIQRKKGGSPFKDLFYHLVLSFSLVPSSFSF